MIRHYWTVITKKTVIDQETNVLVLGEVIEDVTFTLPNDLKNKFAEDIGTQGSAPFPLMFEVVSFLEGTSGEKECVLELDIELPNKKVVNAGSTSVKLGDNGRVRNRFRSNGVPVSGDGINWFRVYNKTDKKRELLAEIPVHIKINFAQENTP